MCILDWWIETPYVLPDAGPRVYAPSWRMGIPVGHCSPDRIPAACTPVVRVGETAEGPVMLPRALTMVCNEDRPLRRERGTAPPGVVEVVVPE